MCGILGLLFTNRNNAFKSKARKVINELFLQSESRGKEAAGYCLINQKQIQVGKTAFPAGKMLHNSQYNKSINEFLQDDSDFFLAFGHSRLVTHGYEHFFQNNQPVVFNDQILVHNGIVVNYKDIWKQLLPDKKPASDLDSEVIAAIYQHCLEKGQIPSEALQTLFNQVDGVVNIALFDKKNSLMILASNNGSLFYYHENDILLFASERIFLQRVLKIGNLPTENIHQVTPGNHYIVPIPVSNPAVNISYVNIDENLKGKPVNTSLEHSINYKAPLEFIQFIESAKENISGLKRCNKCLLPETFPGISFDKQGVCNVCRSYSAHVLKGREALMAKLDKLPSDKPLLVAFSGGRDSSYTLHYLKNELHRRVIAYSYDWGMLTDLGRRNQSRMCARLGVEHILVSADIRKKRRNIRLNVEAWLKKPSLGMIPLFMAGDKQYFYHAYKVMKDLDASALIMGENYLEKTGFKTAFSGARQTNSGTMAYQISPANKLQMIKYYVGQFISNPAYINRSIIDTLGATQAYYGLPHDYLNLFDYIPWDENEVENVLIKDYGWETDPETHSTWRIGDGTAAFYNYIYYVIAGFSEIDTFRSNQIREGNILREGALLLVNEENKPRFDSIKWYSDTIGIDFENTIKKINQLPKLYF